MYCTNCGKEINDNVQFCTFCGKKVSNKKESENGKKINPVFLTGIILATIVIGFGVGFLVIFFTSKGRGSSQSVMTSGEIIEDSVEILEEETDSEEAKRTNEEQTQAAKGIEESETMPVKILSEEIMPPEVREELFAEVFAVIPYYWGSMDVEGRLAETIMDNAYFNLNGELTYLPITLESGEAPTPIDLSFDNIKASDIASYFRCKSEELEKFIEDIYGSPLQLPKGEVDCAECQNDGQYLTEWGNSWHVAYEGWHIERGELTIEQADNELTISFPYTEYSLDGDSVWRCETKWIANPDSVLGFTMTAIQNTRQKKDLSYLTAEDIETERLRIRDLIAAGAAEVIREEAGTGGLPWKKEYYYENGDLVFVFFYNATDGTEDYRFYFMDGVMIRWMIGTSPNQIQYNLSDSSLPDEWSTWETTILGLNSR